MAIVVLAQGLIVGQAANGNAPKDPTCTVQKDETEVFIGFLRLNLLPKGPIALVNTSEATNGNMDKFADTLHAVKGYTIPIELREDFKSRNESSCTIRAFTGIKNLRFISESDWAGRSEIQKRHGKNEVLIRFSRVGFNSDKSLASLHVSYGVDHVAGSGTLYLLKKEADAWKIALTVNTQLSAGPARH